MIIRIIAALALSLSTYSMAAPGIEELPVNTQDEAATRAPKKEDFRNVRVYGFMDSDSAHIFGNEQVGGNLSVTRNLTVGGTLVVDGGITVTGTITGNVIGNVTGDLTGNVTGDVTGNLFGNATSATTSVTSQWFTEALAGDVIGTQLATQVATVGGKTAAEVVTSVDMTQAATTIATPGTLVLRDDTGGFAGNLFGNATSATTSVTAQWFTEALVGEVTGGQLNTVVSNAVSANTPNAIVRRDASGNFDAAIIAAAAVTLSDSILADAQATTKQYVDGAVAGGLDPHMSASVLGYSSTTTAGLYTLDGVALTENARVLLVGQGGMTSTPDIYNGLWLAHNAADWTRPADFANTTTALGAYVLIEQGTTWAGSSWLCNTPDAVIGTDPIGFQQFSSPINVTGANPAGGTGQVFQNKTNQTLNFRSLRGGTNILVSTPTNGDTTITFSTTDPIVSNLTGNVTGRVYAPATNANDPSITFATDTDTGIYRPSSNVIGFTTGNTSRATISDSAVTLQVPVQVPNGTEGAPSISFSSDPNTGIYHHTSLNGVFVFSSNGEDKFIIEPDFNATYTQLQLQAISSASTPALSFIGDSNTGIYRPSPDVIGFSVGGVNEATISSSAITLQEPVLVPFGSATAPAYTFSSDTDSGMYFASSGATSQVRFVANGGTSRLGVGNEFVQIDGGLAIGSNGSMFSSASSVNISDDVSVVYLNPASGSAVTVNSPQLHEGQITSFVSLKLLSSISVSFEIDGISIGTFSIAPKTALTLLYHNSSGAVGDSTAWIRLSNVN